MDADRYARGAMHGVRGYLAAVDARMMTLMARAQTAAGLAGALGEVGVFHGRSYLLLRMLAAPGEAVLGADTFPGGEAGAGWTALHAHARRLGVALPRAELRIGRSDALDADALLRDHGPFRLLHVDASHRRDAVRGDAALALRLLGPGGIAVFDDFCEPAWPEVTAAVFDALDAHPDWGVAALSRKKAYVARLADADRIGALVRDDPALARARRPDVELGDRLVPLRGEGPAMLARQILNDRLGRGVVSVLGR